MIHFDNLYASILFAFSIYMIYYYLKKRHQSHFSVSFPTVNTELSKLPISNNLLVHIPFIIRFITFNLIVLTLMRPQYFTHSDISKVKGIEIMITLDISDSMKAQDIKPQRLASAKEVIHNFILERPYDKIGLIVYAGDAYLQSPSSLDHTIVLHALDNVDFGTNIEGGTAIGNALALSVNRLKDSEMKSKVVVLASDGSNNAGEINPSTAADLASAYDVKVYTIGIGKPGYSLVPVTTEDPVRGTITQVLPMEMNEETLKDIAQKTHGIYFNAQSTEKLKEVYEKINDYEKTNINDLSNYRSRELFPYFIIAIFFLIVFETIASQTFLRILP